MIPTSNKDVMRHPIEGTDIVFLIAVPRKYEKALFQRDMRSAGAVFHTDDAMLQAVNEGIRRSVAEDQRAELLEVVAQFKHAKTEATEENPVDQDLAQEVARVEAFLRRNDGDYSELEADREFWLKLAPLFAFKRFVVGWENYDVPVDRAHGTLTDACVEAMPDDYIAAVGWKAITLMSPGSDERKNLISPSLSPETPAPLTADEDHLTTATGG